MSPPLLGSFPLLPVSGPEHLSLPTVAVRQCSSAKLLEFASDDRTVHEDILIGILKAHFAPPAGQAPDLLFMPTSCGWVDPGIHQAPSDTGAPKHCKASTDQSLVQDAWCASRCSASTDQCPETLCTCVANQVAEVANHSTPAPRLGYFAVGASPWGASPQAGLLMQPLLEQQWPKRMVILSTEIPAFAARWYGITAEPEMRQHLTWGENHPPVAGLPVPYPSADPPAVVPSLTERPILAAFIGSVSTGKVGSGLGKTTDRSPLRELLVKECEDPANAGECRVVSDVDTGREVHGANLGMGRVTTLAAEETYRKARFAFCPWGDTLSQKSTFDALMQGSIPVFFEGVMAKQYAQFGPMKNVSVQIPLGVVAEGGALKYLHALPVDKVRRLHENVLRLRLLFHMPSSVASYVRGDAVDRIVRKVAAHFSSTSTPRPTLSLPQSGRVAVLLRGQAFRSGGRQAGHSGLWGCATGARDAQMNATRSLIDMITRPLREVQRNTVDVIVSEASGEDGPCPLTWKLKDAFAAEHLLAFEPQKDAGGQAESMRVALELFKARADPASYDLILIVRHDLRWKLPIDTWHAPVDFAKLNFFSRCEPSSGSSMGCVEDMVLTMPGRDFAAFDGQVGSGNCFVHEVIDGAGHGCVQQVHAKLGYEPGLLTDWRPTRRQWKLEPGSNTRIASCPLLESMSATNMGNLPVRIEH